MPPQPASVTNKANPSPASAPDSEAQTGDNGQSGSSSGDSAGSEGSGGGTARTQSLLQRGRGRLGTVLTGFRGLLGEQAVQQARRKTLLGE